MPNSELEFFGNGLTHMKKIGEPEPEPDPCGGSREVPIHFGGVEIGRVPCPWCCGGDDDG